MPLLLKPIALALLTGIIALIIPKKVKLARNLIALVSSFLILLLSIRLFILRPLEWLVNGEVFFSLDGLSGFIFLAISLFGFLITLYSIGLNKETEYKTYFAYIFWTIAVSQAAVLANNIIALVVFWGFLGLTLYLLVNQGGPDVAPVSKKAFIIIGGSDCFLILGLAILCSMAETLNMHEINIPISGRLSTISFLCLLIAALAKAGAMPFHTWVPDVAEKGPVAVTAFLPASLDKLLGIYLLARICMSLYILNNAMQMVLLIVGSVTIIAAVKMALIQHDMKRLLGYHAVSQVGYMVLGFGTGNPIGIMGALFHMINNTIYKTSLFLSAGAVESRTKDSDLDRLGGLAKVMPLTFVCAFIASLAISGVPPFNGFVSKWMIYQGIITLGNSGHKLWIIWLVAAMFGSALTLASFIKLLHAVFLGEMSDRLKQKLSQMKKAGIALVLPMVVLSLLCIIFGIFAFKIPLPFINEALDTQVSYPGVWQASLATLFILIGLAIGGVIYLMGNVKGIRESDTYIGGEKTNEEMRQSGVNFYDTIKNMRGLRTMYALAHRKVFDIYDQGGKVTFYITGLLKKLHSGVLLSYLTWVLFGLLALLVIFLENIF